MRCSEDEPEEKNGKWKKRGSNNLFPPSFPFSLFNFQLAFAIFLRSGFGR